jgi:hypothetical protein
MAKEGGKKMSSREMQEILIENFVGLQRAMTNLSIKFEGLSDQISKLLEIFELSAKNFSSQNVGDDKLIVDKLNSLLDQNKTIARGLVVLEEKLRGQSPSYDQEPSQSQDSRRPKPLPRI